MILKHADSKDTQIAELERLLNVCPPDCRPKIKQELQLIRAGIQGERESAYLIDFYLKASNKTGVIHDLRLVVNGRIAQIDHVLLHRTLNIFVLETKHFHAGLKITEEGEFLRWNNYRKTYEGMASPLAQNQRHIDVLKEAMAGIDMPKRLGVRLAPVFHSFVLVSPEARIDRPKHFDTSQVIKADLLLDAIERKLGSSGVLDTLGSVSRLVSMDTIQEIGQQLIKLHQPYKVDYQAKFGISTATQASQELKCRSCASNRIIIQHGRYGYYFKCQACGRNTPIKIDCGNTGHKERLRKAGLKFYRECADCQTSSLFFVNPPGTN
ncbi:MAG: NERD domain-containing protein [Alicyclobacillus sp.]|nr:NERD domain-containing protein [Alicyclobacillus sp.]